MNMNPKLMQLLRIARDRQEGGSFLDDELEGYFLKMKTLHGAYLEDPAQWPWLDEVNGYIKTLRMLVGHFPLVPPVATAVVLDDSMRILLEKRSDDKKWSIPGGIVGPNQSVKECIVADISRETGLTTEMQNLHLFDELSGKAHYYPNGDIIYSVKIVYVAKHCTGELQTNYENLKLKYFDLHQIPGNVSGSTKQIVASLIERLEEVKNW